MIKPPDSSDQKQEATNVNQASRSMPDGETLPDAHNRHLAGMEILSNTLLTAITVRDVAELTLEHTKKATDSACGTIGILDPQTGALTAPTLTRENLDKCEIPLKQGVFHTFTGLWSWVLNNKRSLLTNNPSRDSRSSGTPQGHPPIKRFLAVPAMDGDTVIGLIALANADRDYTDRDLLYLERLTSVFVLGLRRAQTAEALQDSNQRFRGLFERAPDAIFIADIETGSIIDANQAAGRLMGTERARLIGMHQSDLHPVRLRDHARSIFAEHIAQVSAGLVTRAGRTSVLALDGSEKPVEILAQVMVMNGRRVLYGVFRDISAQVRHEEELSTSQQRYRELLESVTSYIYTVRLENGVPISTAHGPGCLSVTGYTPDEYSADDQLWYRMIHDEDKPTVLDQTARLLRGEQPRPLEHRLIHKNGSTRWIRNVQVPHYDDQGRLISYDGLITDITERKHAEDFARNILQTVDEGFIVIDREYNIVSVNKAYATAVGMTADKIIGKKCYEVSHHILTPCYTHGEECAVRRVFETGEPHSATHTHHDAAGNPTYVETKAFPLRDESGQVSAAIEILNNVTDKRRLEAQLRHSQKMETVGLLAGGIAHDFNNILTAIVGYGNLIKMKMPVNDQLQPYVEQVLASAARAANLTQGLLAFSRKQIINPRPIEINDAIGRVDKLLQRVIGEDVELKTILSDSGLTIMADSSQIEQILMNLATNARDAMPDGGVLTIRTTTVQIGEEFRRIHGFGKDGPYAVITVADTGVGMEEAVRDRIFEPFFTTKELGHGTGLGLSMVYGIMKQNNGYVLVDSTPDEGSTFTLFFPLISATMESPVVSRESSPQGGQETILIAEDDPMGRDIIRTVLSEFGYTVIEAVDGDEAVHKFRENQAAIRLVILDVIMPKKNGNEVRAEIARMRPDMKILFLSGYSADVVRKKGIIENDLTLIQKPISPTDLLAAVRKILDHRS